jgi:hypothetical protein
VTACSATASGARRNGPSTPTSSITRQTSWLAPGRASGRRGKAGDCVTRAIAIAAELEYDQVYQFLAEGQADRGKPRSARSGVSPKVYKPWLEQVLGFTWTPTMRIGSGCQVHLRADELPAGRIICRLTRHLVAVIDGTVHDTHDPSRGGSRCVYGYWSRP